MIYRCSPTICQFWHNLFFCLIDSSEWWMPSYVCNQTLQRSLVNQMKVTVSKHYSFYLTTILFFLFFCYLSLHKKTINKACQFFCVKFEEGGNIDLFASIDLPSQTRVKKKTVWHSEHLQTCFLKKRNFFNALKCALFTRKNVVFSNACLTGWKKVMNCWSSIELILLTEVGSSEISKSSYIKLVGITFSPRSLFLNVSQTGLIWQEKELLVLHLWFIL
jgi:hypothetical protein